MGIGGVSMTGGMTGPQAMNSAPVDYSSKKIQNEISQAQRRKQETASRDDIPAEEKRQKRQEIQQEISSLNVKLRQSQAEAKKDAQKEAAARERLKELTGTEDSRKDKAELQDISAGSSKDSKTEDKKSGIDGTDKKKDSDKTDTENKAVDSKEKKQDGTGIPAGEIQAVAAADLAREQVRRRSEVIARMEEGVVILKGEIGQDKARGFDTTGKEEELAKREKRALWAASSDFTDYGRASKMMNEAAQGNAVGRKTGAAENDGAVIRATNFAKEKEQTQQAQQQQFFASVGIHM